MKNSRVRDLLRFSPTAPAVVAADAALREVAKKLVEDPRTREVYVVDEQRHFVGVIHLRRLARCLFSSEIPDKSSPSSLLDLITAQTAEDLVLRKPAYVVEDDDFSRLLEVMFRYELSEIPVLDEDMSIVGNINMLEVVAAWLDGRLDGLVG